ncbi:MAG: 16S rRNA (guanine(966)-N(2))-methyltransferase RsmD [Lachnospiraceae bacterium]|nr:16S rRNA (guanine(966)-N(2))-methyltransferase RsmD [Lachnospiraceae bacterium]
MRVIAGTARRLNLVTPKGMNTRPTSDKIKETLFNILAFDLPGVYFLDLFSGSGGIGIEALSRGAKFCTFIEKDKDALACIRKNLDTTGFTGKSEVMGHDVFSTLYNLHPKEKYDIVFMDPPYDSGFEKNALSILAHLDIISDEAVIIIESSKDTDYSFAEGLGFTVTRVKDYKNNKHVFLKRT